MLKKVWQQESCLMESVGKGIEYLSATVCLFKKRKSFVMRYPPVVSRQPCVQAHHMEIRPEWAPWGLATVEFPFSIFFVFLGSIGVPSGRQRSLVPDVMFCLVAQWPVEIFHIKQGWVKVKQLLQWRCLFSQGTVHFGSDFRFGCCFFWRCCAFLPR